MCPRHVEDNVLFNIEIKNTVTDCFSQVTIPTVHVIGDCYDAALFCDLHCTRERGF